MCYFVSLLSFDSLCFSYLDVFSHMMSKKGGTVDDVTIHISRFFLVFTLHSNGHNSIDSLIFTLHFHIAF